MTDEAVVEEKEYKYLLCPASAYAGAEKERVLRRWTGESKKDLLEAFSSWSDPTYWFTDCWEYQQLTENNQREVTKEQAEAFMREEEVD